MTPRFCFYTTKTITKTSWFPLRVSYSSERRLLQLRDLLAAEPSVGETYVPMEWQMTDSGLRSVPAISNLIFLHTDYDSLSMLRRNGRYEPLRYIMRPVLAADGTQQNELLTVPEAQMRQFIRVTSERSDQVVYLKNMAYACRPGARVMITDGPFAGVEGIVKSLKKHLCVVLPIHDVAAVAITNIPKKHLIYINTNENDNDNENFVPYGLPSR